MLRKLGRRHQVGGDWMTICIVARCRENDSFIVAGDRLFSYGGQFTYESISLKRVQVTLDRRWECMFAGAVSNVLPIVRRVRKELRIRRPPYRLELVERAFIGAYHSYREQLVNDGILSVYGTDLDTFRREGLNFGAKKCASIISQIDNVRIGVEFIVYGYDDMNQAHLFTLNESDRPPFVVESVCRDQDAIAVIGCGWGYAVPSLTKPPPSVLDSQVELLCRVCEAKFEAENDPEVGTDSAAGVINRPAGTTQRMSEAFLRPVALQAIRDAHAQRRDRPYPKELLDALMECVDSNLTSERMAEAIQRAETEIIAENQRRRGR
jgi:hypothetical protein